ARRPNPALHQTRRACRLSQPGLWLPGPAGQVSFLFGRLGVPMLKLYKRGRNGVRYWEAWSLFGTVVVHEGKLGERGKERFRAPAEDQSAEQFIEEAARKPRAKGYVEIPRQERRQVVVQYRLETWGTPEDLEKARQVENLLNGCLGWSGNGRCTGHDF